MAGEKEDYFKEIDVAFLVHELKDPVAVIETGIRALLERTDKFGPLSDRQKRTLRRSLRNSRKARSMLNELLEIGRGECGFFVMETFSPAEAVFTALIEAAEAYSSHLAEMTGPERSPHQILEDLQRENIFWDVSPQAGQAQIAQDAVKFRHIVRNLIKNALYYRKKRLDIRIGLESNGLQVSVGDDGPGVPPDFRQKIFQRYTQAASSSGQAHRDGHGIGLAGARALARCLGGDLQVESGRGGGADFRLWLPARPGGGSMPPA